jgi:hypothetical protein
MNSEETLKLQKDVEQALNFVSRAGELLNNINLTLKPPKTEQNKPQATVETQKYTGKCDYATGMKLTFPEEVREKLCFEHCLDSQGKVYVKVKPVKHLGSDCFNLVMANVRNLGGKYVSAGRDSHFQIYPKETA